jgi:riboflavin synthase
MFTGLVEEVGRVTRLERRGDSAHLAVRASKVLEGTVVGDSIAVSGACLTVVSMSGDGFVVDAMPETLSHTTLGRASAGALVNLERSLVVGGRLGGHLVLGHVDAMATVLAVEPEGIAWRVRVSLPEAVAACVAPKGSIAVDGISLTVIDVGEGSFSVGVIPHTLRETTLSAVKAGMRVNLEADVLARYVLRTLQNLTQSGDPRAAGGIGGAPATDAGGLTEEFLRGQGFA